MGIAWLLLRRTFKNRPRRTLLFLFGYGLATAVMITLLSVGEAVLLQARDKDLLGGGDIILVPQGIDIESMKVGGISSLYYSIPQARFIVRQFLNSTRFRNEIAAISPYIYSKLLYVRRASEMQPAFAEGSFPEQEKQLRNHSLPWKNTPQDQEWLSPSPQNFYHSIDHFHFPLEPDLNPHHWAEWHYFNFSSDRFHGYLSILAGGDIGGGKGKWVVSFQIEDDRYRRYAATYPASVEQLPLQSVNYSISKNRIQFIKDHYQIELNIPEAKGILRYYPAPRMYFPPVILGRNQGFLSGYVIPALRGTYRGKLQADGRLYDFNGAEGYHDHNWGIWRHPESEKVPVLWNWGRLNSEKYALFFGEIFWKDKSKGVFAGVFDPNGFFAMFRPPRIEFSDFRPTPEGIFVPRILGMQDRKRYTSLELKGVADSVVTTPVEDTHFVQYKMTFEVTLMVDGKTEHFKATGNAETYVKDRFAQVRKKE